QTAAPRGEEPAARDEVPSLPVWVRQAAPSEPLPPRPLAPSRSESEPPVRTPLAAGGGSGLKRGRLVHRLLQFLPVLPPPERAAAATRWLGQPVHRLAPAEQEELLAETLAVIATPLAAPLFGPDSLAEVPLAGEVGGRLIAGQVDRLIVTRDRVIILDYKTDRPPPVRDEDVPAPYIRQMAAYRAALMRIYPERAVDCLLLWTYGPRLMALDGRRLDAVVA
ncbi:MAG: PD-(D/E)XK nuclease family protein, partial [Rhodospirillales bacterium]|nr:PD-(D/E)XK nuclease family protein [Rhodospirillales bacterium]